MKKIIFFFVIVISVTASIGINICAQEPGTMLDIRDSIIYRTVKIGDQIWMAENLKATTYRNGTPIPNVTDDTLWENLTIGAYSWYNNDATIYKNPYGALYNWYAVETGKLCPTGWHVPSYEEWITLANYLGGYKIAGGKLKDADTTYWGSPNEGATNESGFTALPVGWRRDDGTFRPLGGAMWWASTTKSKYKDVQGEPWFWVIFREQISIKANYFFSKGFGLSVRCLKD